MEEAPLNGGWFASLQGGSATCKLSNGLFCGAGAHLVYVWVPLESLISSSSCVLQRLWCRFCWAAERSHVEIVTTALHHTSL